jgi:hypothetical protein
MMFVSSRRHVRLMYEPRIDRLAEILIDGVASSAAMAGLCPMICKG